MQVVLTSSYALSCFIISQPTELGPTITDEKMDLRGKEIICSRSLSQEVAKPILESRSPKA